ncbi:hypothetical protein PR048_029289 [Dryococelus australis]|uniref:DDE-1 domain-containing protein n=1 Tax=Dryococelus australis TaxID=614101 RepID=A0ABQ9GFP9_9NEOP|nr:hypothetical protein PR048_029289 [Dryococelus australis]
MPFNGARGSVFESCSSVVRFSLQAPLPFGSLPTILGVASQYLEPKMRTYKRKSVRGKTPSDIMETASKLVKENPDSHRAHTVIKPCKIIAIKRMKQVGSVTSTERGEMITVTSAISAIGNALPPMFIFRRKKFRVHFVRDAPETFLTFIKRFIEHTSPSLTSPVLLLGNHSSHFSCPVWDMCKEKALFSYHSLIIIHIVFNP